MAITLGSQRGPRSEINMTPMIDVLLVLIIIFMLIAPIRSRGLDALVPQAAAPDHSDASPTHAIVVTAREDGRAMLNQEVMDLPELQRRLSMLARIGARVVFVRGDKSLEFSRVAAVIDLAREAGVFQVALMTT